MTAEPGNSQSREVKTVRGAVQALRAQRAAEQPAAKKRKRDHDDEGASSAEDMSDSDDAVGPPTLSI